MWDSTTGDVVSLRRAQEHQAKLETLISAGVGMTEIQRALGLRYAAVYDMIRLLGLPKPADTRLRHFASKLSSSPQN